ncbi:MAG TPA: MBL fold metallo-hydrolase [Candidatus Limnocylindrales bacterium]|nr:MBL fold metallo-hydrolase [Candidatus Limnocylindrales bacterium]
MDAWQPLDRRTFLADMGKGAFALAVVSIAACGPGAVASSQPPASRAAASGTPPPPPASGGSGASQAAPPSAPPPASAAAGAVTWERVNLGFVSAYILVRGGEAAIVDTGVAGSGDEIEASLGAVGLEWSAVGHLILTHHHNDHQGSAPEVLERAPDAVAYAGAEDVPAISVPRPLTAVGDGDEVFGLRIVTTPGHTAGSISVLDPVGGILVAGDALRTDGGKPTPPGGQFTVDMDQAMQSIVKLGGLSFETLLVGHGEPLVGGASAAVAALGAAG